MSIITISKADLYEYNIRSRLNYYIPLVRTTSIQKSLFQDGLRLYNSLPETVKQINGIKVFLSRIKKFIFSEKFCYNSFSTSMTSFSQPVYSF